MDSIDLRDAFFDGLYDLMVKNENIIILTADHGAFGLKEIERNLPNQYFNMGIAEQNMASVASGLAQCGKIVYIYSINSFVTQRCFEQLNIDVASMELNINIVGVGAGLTYSIDGLTHHGTQDIAIMNTLPNITIFNCVDEFSTKYFCEKSYNITRPVYIRIEKGIVPPVYKKNEDLKFGYSILKEGQNTCIITSGLMVHKVLKAVDLVKKRTGDKVKLIDLFRIKPIENKIIEEFKGIRKLVVVEDNIMTGSIYMNITSLVAEAQLSIECVPINLGEKYIYKYYSNREKLEEVAGLSLERIVQALSC